MTESEWRDNARYRTMAVLLRELTGIRANRLSLEVPVAMSLTRPKNAGMSRLKPGVYFVNTPIELPPDWKVALHMGADGQPMCCVMIAPEYAGPAFVMDSRAWWKAHFTDPAAPPLPAFGRSLSLVRDPEPDAPADPPFPQP